MITINPEQTLAELVLERPERARIFEGLQLDYCCGGNRSLEAAATHSNFDIQTLIAVIQAGELSAKVANRHGDTLPGLIELDALVNTMGDELIEHIDLEERKLFPTCRALDAPAEVRRTAPVVGPPLLRMHEAAHDNVGHALAEIRKLADDYNQDQALCSSHRRLLSSLEALERDLHQHIHEENNILFPRLRPPSD